MADLYRYGVQDVLLFTLVKRFTTDYATSGDYVPVVSDIRIGKDGASESYAANACAFATTTDRTVVLTLSAAELSAKKIVVTLIDAATPNKAVEDQAMLIHTFGSPLAQMPFDLSINTVTVATVNDKTGYSVGTGGITSASFGAAALDAAALSVDAGAELADAFLNRHVAAGHSDGRTVKEALQTMRNKVSVRDGIVFATDDPATLFTFTTARDSDAPRVTVWDPA